MKTFEFAAFDSSGERKTGAVSARSLPEAKKKVQQRGFYLASITVQDVSASGGQSSFSFFKELKEFFFSKGRVNI